MNSDELENIDLKKANDFVPILLIVGGIGLIFLGIDRYGIAMNLGFAAYGGLGLADSFALKYHRDLSVKSIKILGQVMIILLAIYNLVSPISLMFLLMLILFDRIVLTPGRLEDRL